MNNKIGELLRDARIEKRLSFDDVVEKTGIAPHYILAMELDQLKLLPEGKTNEYLEQYARAVDLDPVSIIHGYRNQELSDDLIVPAPNDNAAPEPQTDDKDDNTEEIEVKVADKYFNVTQELPIDIDVTQEITSNKSEKNSDKESKRKKSDADIAPEESEKLPSRLSRHSYGKEPQKGFPWTLLVLILLALGIVSYVGYVVYNQLQTDSHKTERSSSQKSSSNSNDNKTSTAQNQTKLETDFANGGNNVTVSNANGKVEITVTLTGSEDNWLSVTNTNEGEAQTTLTADNKSYTATLAEGATNSTLTINSLSNAEIAINGQKLDTSNLVNAGLNSINLTIQ
ncbi:helix-turn-helix domain-containing protein [Streptococcus macacae]|uniref:DUF4115 domain-containing protein n=1 Tax=Streptococcus macacae NCTC 11558 TaxID=764298 RepID=G5JXI7_9STRE|nr:helix-turn-helix transcriptional regulator [Streptococcus macacae]EHJ53002.1 hypothetical protein STRMA_1587 [Streptococcus macacae NCTC 11558]SUN79758.1 membrane protein [Streptococcus macacae NCTC 11558]